MSEAPRRIRRAARILLSDPQGRVLLFRFTPRSGQPFWLPPGGECDPGEDFHDTARRELLEETGIAADPVALGVVIEQSFTAFDGEEVLAREHIFHHATRHTRIDVSGHTEKERNHMAEHRWFEPHELADWHEIIFPAEVVRLALELGGAER